MQEAFTLEGTVLERNYRVVRIVAEGGFALVYAGEHASLRIPIAIKVLKPVAGHSDELLARFALEAQTIARLKHPDIVQVLDTGVLVLPAYPRGLPWIVLEWLAGETMKEHLAARRGGGGRRPSECLSLMRPVFSAIAHAHDEGIAHRDIKPSNVMLARSSRGVSAKVLDFGIAKMMEGDDRPVTGHTATEGTVRAFSRHYAAPEQLAGSRTGPWTDIHALALMMSELLTDEPPYPGDDAFELSQSIFDPVRPTPKKLGVSVGPWELALSRALSLKAGDRQESAQLLFEELERDVEAADAVWAPKIGPRVAPTNTTEANSTPMSKGATGGTYSRTADVDVQPRRRWRYALPAAVALAGVALVVGVQRSATPHDEGPAPTIEKRAERAPTAPVVSMATSTAPVESTLVQVASTEAPPPTVSARAVTPRRASPPPRVTATGESKPVSPAPARSSGTPLPYVLE
jgi:eukaryotic-like serine/threonine-protein kinase